MKNENVYQTKLKDKIEERFDGCIVLKNDPEFFQGIPDLTILFPNKRWACLEVKRSKDSPPQPNQPYYVALLNEMGFASFIYPENEEAVLNALEQSLED